MSCYNMVKGEGVVGVSLLKRVHADQGYKCGGEWFALKFTTGFQHTEHLQVRLGCTCLASFAGNGRLGKGTEKTKAGMASEKR